MPTIRLEDQIEEWHGIASCFGSGELILTPFEQPIEEERRGDPDQGDDELVFQKQNLCEFVRDGGPSAKTVREIPHDNRFRYFLDGSVRTKYLGEYVEGNLSVPLIVADISVAVMERKSRKLEPASYRKNLFFVLPHKNSGFLTDTTFDKLEERSQELARSGGLSRIEFLSKSDVKGDVRYSLLGKVRRLMHDMEHDAAVQLPRGRDDWLIMDGAIRKQEFLDLNNVIGLAKSFSRKPVFVHRGSQITLGAYMKTLGDGYRSALVKKSSPEDEISRNLVFWYLRLRTFPPMEPLGGIVKIDLKSPEGGPDVEALADEISSEVYAMRLPSVYPWPRWPSYIYPIRLAEIYMSARYLGDFVLSQVGNELKTSIR